MNNTNLPSIETTLGTFTPGVSTVENLKAIETPSKVIEQADKIIYTYASTDVSRPHIVHVKDGIITFVQIVVDQTLPYTQEDVTNKYGQPEETSFSTHTSDSPVYSYPQKGLTFIFDGMTKQTLLIQKYIPTTKEVFKETVGKDFSTQQYGDVFPTATTQGVVPSGEPGNQPVSIQTSTLLYIVSALVFVILSTVFVIIFLKIKKRRQSINMPPPVF